MVDVARTAAAAAVVAILCSVLYRELYTSFSAHHTHGFVFPSGIPAAGLEDVNFFALLSKSESAMQESCLFAVFLVAMTLDSHVAVLGLFSIGRASVDVLIFGADEALTKSPFAWWKVALTPGILASQYMTWFWDTNPVLSLVITLNVLSHDLLFFTTFASSLATGTPLITLLFDRCAGAVVVVCVSLVVYVFSGVLVSLLALLPVELLLVALAVSVSARALHNLFNVRKLVAEAAVVFALRAQTAVDAARKRDVEAALRSRAPPLLKTDWRDLYIEDAQIEGRAPAGANGAVLFGRTRDSNLRVCIKIFKDREGLATTLPKISTSILRLIMGEGHDVPAEVVEGLKTEWARSRGEVFSYTRELAAFEVLALRAIKGMRHPNFIDLLSAHEEDAVTKSPVIVTACAGPTLRALKRTQSVDAKRLVLHRTVCALADLHACGLVHRDVKDDNIATHPSDPTQPIILDVGLMRLPSWCANPTGGALANTGCGGCMPPELLRPALRLPDPLGLDDGENKRFVAAPLELAQKHDVFSTGLLIAEHLHAFPEVTSAWSAAHVESFFDAARVTDEPLKDLLRGMLHADPVARMTMREAAAHRAFTATATALDVPPMPHAATPHIFDRGGGRQDGPRALAARMLARHTRLAFVRTLVRAIAKTGVGVRRVSHIDAGTLVRQLKAAVGAAGGRVTRAAFAAVLARTELGAVFAAVDSGELFTLLDDNESDTLDRRELLSGVAFLLAPLLDEPSRLRLLFDVFDDDDSGALEKGELRAMLAAFGLPAHDATPAEALEQEDFVDALLRGRESLTWGDFQDALAHCGRALPWHDACSGALGSTDSAGGAAAIA